MPRVPTGIDVFSMAVDRMKAIYEQGHRVVVSCSGGKDSTCCVEVCRVAAMETGRLPVEIMFRDEEAYYPGIGEYLLRLADDPDIRVHWLVAGQPSLNIFNRECPYWWCFDDRLAPGQWITRPPDWHTRISSLAIEHTTSPQLFPPASGKDLYAVIGLRVVESRGRLYGLFSSGSYLTKPNRFGVRSARPIYDWNDGDVWRAISEFKWDHCEAYNTLYRLGMKPHDLRIAPPTMNAAGISALPYLAKAWPQWFDKLCTRLPGVRTAMQFGKRVVEPERHTGESWEETFKRECIEKAPTWIAERSREAMRKILSMHRKHASNPLPEITPCYNCSGNMGSWKALAKAMYCGDPFSTKFNALPWVEPETFRKGAGTWGGTPSW